MRHSRDTNMGVRFLTAVELDSLAAAAAAGAMSSAAPVEPAQPVTGTELRRTLFGIGKPVEDTIVRKITPHSGGFSRHS